MFVANHACYSPLDKILMSPLAIFTLCDLFFPSPFLSTVNTLHHHVPIITLFVVKLLAYRITSPWRENHHTTAPTETYLQFHPLIPHDYGIKWKLSGAMNRVQCKTKIHICSILVFVERGLAPFATTLVTLRLFCFLLLFFFV